MKRTKLNLIWTYIVLVMYFIGTIPCLVEFTSTTVLISLYWLCFVLLVHCLSPLGERAGRLVDLTKSRHIQMLLRSGKVITLDDL